MKKLYEESNINNIALAIQAKLGISSKYKVSDMAQAILNIPTGGMTFLERVRSNNERLWDSLGISTNNPSEVIYYPANGTYFMLPFTTPISLLLTVGYITGVNGGLKANTIEFNPYVNGSGRLATHSNYTTSTTKRVLLDQPCLSSDYSNTATSWIDLTGNTGDLFTSPLYITNLSLANTHPALYSRFSNMAQVTLSNFFDGTIKFTPDEIFAHTNVPAGFDLNNITQGYLLYKQNSFNFVVSEASDTQIYVDANNKLNSTSAQTYQTTFFGVPSSVASTKISKQLYSYNSTIYGAQADTVLADNMVLTTNDIYNSNNELVMSANATLTEFKNCFVLSS